METFDASEVTGIVWRRPRIRTWRAELGGWAILLALIAVTLAISLNPLNP